jgi:uncharacterized membrane protein YfcA
MALTDIPLVGLIIMLAAVGQSAVGFGYALFATPLLLWVGLPLPAVITMIATPSLLQSALAVWSLRASVPWRLSLTATGVRLVSVVAGLMLLKRLVGLNPAHVRTAVGAILCALVGLQFAFRPVPAARLHWGWGAAAFSASGLLAGICGMGGPPLVLWAMAHNWSSEKTRGFLFATFLTAIPVQLAMLAVVFGAGVLWNALIGAAFFPLVFLGASIGLPVGNRMPKPRLRAVAYAVLLLIGLSAVLSPLLGR